MCDAREHTARRRIGKVACGECFETVIRADERLAMAAIAAVPMPAFNGGVTR
jgi:ParB family chromosome partitioning protein